LFFFFILFLFLFILLLCTSSKIHCGFILRRIFFTFFFIRPVYSHRVAHKKVKFLNSGEYKRLSIAEEIVHGPKLLLIDEPITGVSLRESSILLNTFREMVNADRTVICSMYHPSVEAFNLFDSLLLLSKGRVIYSGRIGAATEFFTQSPYQYSLAGYTNPADFLADISSSQLPDSKVNTLFICDVILM